MARWHVLRYVSSSPRHASKSNLAFFLPDTLAVRFLSSSFAFCFCKLPVALFTNSFQSIRVTMHVVKTLCVKCCHWWRILHGSSFNGLTQWLLLLLQQIKCLIRHSSESLWSIYNALIWGPEQERGGGIDVVTRLENSIRTEVAGFCFFCTMIACDGDQWLLAPQALDTRHCRQYVVTMMTIWLSHYKPGVFEYLFARRLIKKVSHTMYINYIVFPSQSKCSNAPWPSG